MYNIKYDKIMKRCKKAFVCIIAFVFFLVMGILFGNSNKLSLTKYDSIAEATLIDTKCNNTGNGVKCYNLYEYEINNKTYICGYKNTFNEFLKERAIKTNTIYYSSNNPNDCEVQYNFFGEFSIIFYIISSIFIIRGVILIVDIIKKINKLNHLKKYGTLYKVSYTIKENKNNPNIVLPIVQYTSKTGEILTLTAYRYVSRTICEQNNTIDLLIDINNPSNYYMNFYIDKNN